MVMTYQRDDNPMGYGGSERHGPDRHFLCLGCTSIWGCMTGAPRRIFDADPVPIPRHLRIGIPLSALSGTASQLGLATQLCTPKKSRNLDYQQSLTVVWKPKVSGLHGFLDALKRLSSTLRPALCRHQWSWPESTSGAKTACHPRLGGSAGNLSELGHRNIVKRGHYAGLIPVKNG